MGRNRLDPDSETTTDTFRLSKDLKREFRQMCRERDKDRAEVYRAMMERELHRHRMFKRVKEKAIGAA